MTGVIVSEQLRQFNEIHQSLGFAEHLHMGFYWSHTYRVSSDWIILDPLHNTALIKQPGKHALCRSYARFQTEIHNEIAGEPKEAQRREDRSFRLCHTQKGTLISPNAPASTEKDIQTRLFKKVGTDKKMKSFFVLAILSFLMMVRSCHSSCEEIQEPIGSDLQIKDSSSVNTLPRSFLKRFYDGMNYDGFVGLMGKRTAGKLQVFGDMHDFFVGLMGRRNTENGNPVPLKKETFPESRGTIFPNKCKMRFRRFV
ncbi:hypothetical protein AOXY_G32895 [Acipenser oxyrinchus oxyrinchus]|uniref:Neuromedin-K n=1 Tax=Acipenser oxyrinchus oxyrinchus TaxID=40147 RepID=A0AAD8FTC9_ACIOX|nr:hypothetical protein AOXY_G32895 [Acipenser oxyrinchus oxyrinchus]